MAPHQVGVERKPPDFSFFIRSSVLLVLLIGQTNQPEAREWECLGDAVHRHQPSRAQSRVGRPESGPKGDGKGARAYLEY